MTAFGKKVWHMVLVDLFMLKATFMRANGPKIKHTDMVSNKTTKAAVMKAIGKMINKTVKELKNGQTAQFIQEATKTV